MNKEELIALLKQEVVPYQRVVQSHRDTKSHHLGGCHAVDVVITFSGAENREFTVHINKTENSGNTL